MTEPVIEAMAGIPRVCEALHLPLQSGSNRILKAMLRNYTREEYRELVSRLREAMPAMTLSTDLIVGFPGETDADFRQTLTLAEELGFDWAFVFKYSAREGTAAAAIDGMAESVIEARHRECLDLVERVGGERRARFGGRTEEVLVEEGGFGRTRGNYKVRVEGDFRPGETIPVKITSTDRATLEGAAAAATV
jgi:tRNA-2-methylthio-N6-dimethylallyladenosine synthase